MHRVNKVSGKLPGVIVSPYRIGAYHSTVGLGWIDLVDALRDENHSAGRTQVEKSAMLVVVVLDSGTGVEHGCPKSQRAAWAPVDPNTESSHRVNRQICIEANCRESSKAAIDE